MIMSSDLFKIQYIHNLSTKTALKRVTLKSTSLYKYNVFPLKFNRNINFQLQLSLHDFWFKISDLKVRNGSKLDIGSFLKLIKQ